MYCPQKKPSKEILEGIIRRHKNTIITGDFNSKHEDIGHANSDDSGRTLINTITTHKYTILNDNEPTYTSDRTGRKRRYVLLPRNGEEIRGVLGRGGPRVRP